MRKLPLTVAIGLATVCAVLVGPSVAHAGFEWGTDCSSGENTFDQYIPHQGRVVIEEADQLTSRFADAVIAATGNSHVLLEHAHDVGPRCGDLGPVADHDDIGVDSLLSPH